MKGAEKKARRPRAADDFGLIRARIEELRRGGVVGPGSTESEVYENFLKERFEVSSLQGVDLLAHGSLQEDRSKLLKEFGESKKPGYTHGTMGDATARLEAVAADFGLPIDIAKQVLTAAASELTARENTARATAAPRLKWEHDAKPDETPAHFAARAYQAEAEAGTLHRGMIAQEDKALSVKLANWLRTHDWPEGVRYVPTKPEWNDRQIEAGKAKPVPAPRTPEQRLYDVKKARRLRGLRIA